MSIKLVLKHVVGIDNKCICCGQIKQFTHHCPVLKIENKVQTLIDENKVDYLNGKWVTKTVKDDLTLLQLELTRLNRYLVNTTVDVSRSI